MTRDWLIVARPSDPLLPKKIAAEIVGEVSEQRKISVEDILGRKKRAKVVWARYDAIRRVARAIPYWSASALSKYFHRDHSTILYVLNGGKRSSTNKRLARRRELENLAQ
jgi:chromosomal replication initiation ATPase DnaA